MNKINKFAADFVFIYMLADLDPLERVQKGKGKESQVISALQKIGADIVPAKSSEDLHDKVDAWWKSKKNNKTYSVQIKFRESGDDILFEIIRDVDRNIPGRDMAGNSDLYVVLDRLGTLRVFKTSDIKNKAIELYNLYKKTQKENMVGHGWEYKVQYDRRDGNKKLVAYFEPKLFDVVLEFNVKKYVNEDEFMTVEEQFKDFLIKEEKFLKLDDVEYDIPLGKTWSNILLHLESLYNELNYYKPEYFEFISMKSEQQINKKEIMDALEQIYKLLEKIQPKIKTLTVIEKSI